MDTHPDPGADPKLDALLREARHEPLPPLPPGFRDGVWRRIASEHSPSHAAPVEGWLQGLAAWLLRPRQAALLALGLIVLGSIGGSLAATDAARTAARDRYLAAVDPLRPAP